MKKNYLFLYFMLIITLTIKAQWVQQSNSNVNTHYYSVFATDANTCFVVGTTFYFAGNDWTDFIRKTTDGGSHWTNQTNFNCNELLSVYFADTNNGYAVGNYGTIIKTTNAGNNWTKLTSGSTFNLKSIYFVSTSIGYIVGDGHTILKTTDSGSNWIMQTSGIAGNYSSVYFIDSNIGYVVGANASSYELILKTTNGGTNWTEKSSGISSSSLNAVYFTDANTGFAVVKGSGILKTTNGGDNWIYHGTSTTVNSVYFTDANNGWAAGFTIKHTNNGGIDWLTQGSTMTDEIESIRFANATTGWMVGHNGAIFKTTNGGDWINERYINSIDISIAPNPTNNKICITTKENIQKEVIVSIYNIRGEQVLTNNFYYQNSIEMDVSFLAKGVYVVKIQSEKGVGSVKLVIQ